VTQAKRPDLESKLFRVLNPDCGSSIKLTQELEELVKWRDVVDPDYLRDVSLALGQLIDRAEQYRQQLGVDLGRDVVFDGEVA
jgi:hypothetical protein